jgi:rhodanese-related sulfurtransferase
VKFILDNLGLIIVILISGGALLIPALRRSGAKVSVLQATQLMNQGKHTVLDVRTSAEFQAGHIKGAKNIPLSELAKRIIELEKQKKQTVIVVCNKGVHSATARASLSRADFTQAVSLDGGMAAWLEQGLPTVK